MQYGFLIDHRKCIGCHACTVACKAENDVPVGNFRTWVKYTEKGRFPAIKRHFTVLRCNHCTNAPCVTICPVNALEKRKDGIVDIDRDACIGCRACMQGCPYDSIYLNEEDGAVEKCHFCAHRVEQGLKPACVIVCPEEAIVAGDLHDPTSQIAKMVSEHTTLLRRTEQKTGPNVHYLGVEPTTLEPGLAERPETYIWSERPATKPEPWPASIDTQADLRTVLDAGHKVEWGWQVAAYLVTKGIAAGAALFAPFALPLGLTGNAANYAPEIIALVFITLTTILLIEDLHRPTKFFRLLTRPNTKSWLVRGAWILIAFSNCVLASLVLRYFGFAKSADALRYLDALLALGVAGYTAFLFQQCEGRDLWQEKSLLPHLIVQAVVCGAAALMPFADAKHQLADCFAIGLVLHIAFVMRDARRRRETANARQAAAFLAVARMGSLAKPYQLGTLVGTTVPLGLIVLLALLGAQNDAPFVIWVASLTALVGLFLYKYAFIRAAQLPPLS